MGSDNDDLARASLARLGRIGLLQWSESALNMVPIRGNLPADAENDFDGYLAGLVNQRRKVPVPRRTIRFLAKDGTRLLIATALGHLLRCLYYRNGACCPYGTCKASWIAELFGVDVRNAKAARRHLAEIGWLTLEEAPQWRLNRYGQPARINLNWAGNVSPKAGKPPPPPAVSAIKLPPPCLNRELSTRNKNQEPAVAGSSPGFCKKNAQSPTAQSPTLRSIVPADLHDTRRLMALFAQAVAAGIVSRCEADQLKFLAAAEHAKLVGTQNPCGLFAAVVQRGLWHFVTQRAEDHARTRMRECRNESALPGRTQIPAVCGKTPVGTATAGQILASLLASRQIPQGIRAVASVHKPSMAAAVS